MNTFLFYLLSLGALLGAYFVVTVHNLFRAAVGLITLLLSIAGLYLLINAQFLSAVQITVYVGGIVVLIVYVLLLMSDAAQKFTHESATWRKAVVGVLAAALCVLLAGAVYSFDFRATSLPPQSASVAEIGRSLLSPERKGSVLPMVLPFEVISLLLLAAIIGAITVARSGDGEKKQEQK